MSDAHGLSDAHGARRTVAIVATGDELVTGALVDTNSARIARTLLGHGFEAERVVVLGDDEHALAALLAELSCRYSAVVITGGLGPTLDDITRHAVARAASVELVLAEHVVLELRRQFVTRQQPFSDANARQALFPAGSEILPNPFGTAPGFMCPLNGALVFALPGPPREMLPMLERELVPRLVAAAPSPVAIELQRFYLFGISESRLGEMCGDWMKRQSTPVMGITSGSGVLTVSLRAAHADRGAARSQIDRRASEFRDRLRAYIYSEDEPTLEKVLGRQLIARGIRVTTAESCTGGLLAERLTRVPGISAVFESGFVCYSNRAKSELCGVDAALIERHGAVSREVAAALASGAAARANARLALSITGIAGPDGGSAEKPVGLVWLGVSFDGEVTTEERRFPAYGRDLVREFAASTALDLAQRRIGG